MKKIKIENKPVIDVEHEKGTRPPSRRGPEIPQRTRLESFGDYMRETAHITDEVFLSENRVGTGINKIAYHIEKRYGLKKNSLKSRFKLVAALVRKLITESDEVLGDLFKNYDEVIQKTIKGQ